MAARFTASLSRRRTRLRTTALPTLRETVNPSRAGASSSRLRACSTKPGVEARNPEEAARKSARCRNRSMETRGRWPPSGAQPLTPLRPAGGNHLAASLSRHAGAEAVAALANELARLIGPLHGL